MIEKESLTNKILKTINGYKLSNAIFAAEELNLFDHLEKPITLKELSGQTNLNPLALEILLQVLVWLGILNHIDDSYSLTKETLPLFQKFSDRSLSPLIKLEAYLSQGHADLKAMKTALRGEGKDRFNKNAKEGFASIYGKAMDNGGRYASLCVARAFLPEFSGKVLDLGGGIGTYAIQLCRINKKVEVVVYDRPEMEKICLENIHQRNLENRISFQAMDVKSDPIVDKFEGVIISNLLHLFDPEVNSKIINKVAGAMKENAFLVLHDFFLNDDKTGPDIPLIYSIDWLMLGAYFHLSYKEIKHWLIPYGLFAFEHRKYPEIPTSIIIAKKEGK